MNVKIVIPSMGRAREIFTHKYVSNCSVCIPESELGAYKEHNPDLEYITHPDSLKGLATKRQWIIDKFKNVFMFDDDIKGISRLTQKRGESARVSPDLAYEIVQNAANMAKMCGCYIFSFNVIKQTDFYSGHTPFELTGTLIECGFGILEGADKLRVLPNMMMGYEFYISGLNAYYYRTAFFDKRFCLNFDSWGDTIGGAANLRTLESEKRDTEFLISCFGDAIIRKSDEGKNGKHEFSKRLKIPF